MQKAQILGLVRHILTFAGGYVVARGYGDEATITEVVGGVMTIVGGVWSLVSPEKKA